MEPFSIGFFCIGLFGVVLFVLGFLEQTDLSER